MCGPADHRPTRKSDMQMNKKADTQHLRQTKSATDRRIETDTVNDRQVDRDRNSLAEAKRQATHIDTE